MTADEILRRRNTDKLFARHELLSLLDAATDAIRRQLAVGDGQGYHGKWLHQSVDEHIRHAMDHLKAGELDAVIIRVAMAKAKQDNFTLAGVLAGGEPGAFERAQELAETVPPPPPGWPKLGSQ